MTSELQIEARTTLDSNVSQSTRSTSESFRADFFHGLQIYVASLLTWRIWIYMAFTDIRRRYQRTLIGPFWVTLSIAIFVGSIGVIFPVLWQMEMKSYLPFFASGYILWMFVSSVLSEGCGTFIDSVGLIKQTALPYAVYANNVVIRNVIVLFHHLTVYFIVMLIFQVPMNLNTLLFFPALLLLCFSGSWLCILLGLLSSRFRDIRQMVASVLQISMFVTPIFWSPSQLGTGTKATLLIEMNPLFHFIQVARAPLLGQQPAFSDWMVVLVMGMIGWVITLRVLGKYRKHLVFWL